MVARSYVGIKKSADQHYVIKFSVTSFQALSIERYRLILIKNTSSVVYKKTLVEVNINKEKKSEIYFFI